MIHELVDLHNIEELVSVDGQLGLRMQRVPEQVRSRLDEPAQNKVLNPAGAEIRFVVEGDSATLRLSAPTEPGTARLFFGPFESREPLPVITAEPVDIHVSIPEDARERLSSLPDEITSRLLFHPRVCRLVLFQGIIHFHGVKGNVRPPLAAEVPDLTMLAYGTSITHGMAASAFHLSYVAQTAWRLGTDLINMGVGGACLSEPAFGDYMAARKDWDFATLALSVNMINQGFSPEEFRDRVHYLVGKIAGDNPRKPVRCITIYPYFGDWADLEPMAEGRPDQFRKVLEEVVRDLKKSGMQNLDLINGPEILTEIGGLTVDMIHPSDLGMICMGENLARKLKPVVEQIREGMV